MDNEQEYKNKIRAYNTLRWRGGLTPATSKEAIMAPGDIALSKIAESRYGGATKKRIKYLILAIVNTKGSWSSESKVAYLTKMSFDKRYPTLSSNHEYKVQEIGLFQQSTNVSLKTKLKDL